MLPQNAAVSFLDLLLASNFFCANAIVIFPATYIRQKRIIEDETTCITYGRDGSLTPLFFFLFSPSSLLTRAGTTINKCLYLMNSEEGTFL